MRTRIAKQYGNNLSKGQMECSLIMAMMTVISNHGNVGPATAVYILISTVFFFQLCFSDYKCGEFYVSFFLLFIDGVWFFGVELFRRENFPVAFYFFTFAVRETLSLQTSQTKPKHRRACMALANVQTAPTIGTSPQNSVSTRLFLQLLCTTTQC